MRFHILVLIFSIFELTKGQLKSSDVSEGQCANITADTTANSFFIFGSIKPWYIGMASQFALRFHTEVLLSRSAKNFQELGELQSKSKFLYYDNLFIGSNVAIIGFNGSKVLKSFCLPKNSKLLEFSCNCRHNLFKIGEKEIGKINEPTTDCSQLGQHDVTIIKADEVNEYVLLNICPQIGQRYWFGLMKNYPLSQSVIEKISNEIVQTGFFSRDNIVVQNYTSPLS